MNHVQPFLDFAEALPEPAFLVSGSGYVLGANRGGTRMLGAGRAPGAALQDFVVDPPEKIQRYLSACSRSRSPIIGSLRWISGRGDAPVEYRAEGALVCPSNGDQEALVLLRTMPRSQASARFVVLNRKTEALAREIHERRQAQEALRQSEERLQAILDNSATLVYLKDPRGRYLLVNRKVENVFGMSRAQILGRTGAELFPEPLAQTLESRDRNVLESGEPVEFEESIPFREGVRTFLTVKFPVRDTGGGIYGVCGIAADITERKRFDQQIQQGQKLESLGLLAGGVAHDFNNLLTGIIGNASVALEIAARDNPVRPMLDDIVRAGERAAHLTRQMLAYAGKGKFIVEHLDLTPMVAELAHLLRISIPKKVDLQLRLAPDLPAIEADTAQIQQLIMNLVINGAEAIGENTGTVSITTGYQFFTSEDFRSHFLGDTLAPGLYVKLEVTDTGTGMDRATMARIFDPFFTTKFAGRGLGLAATLGVIRSHKGTVKVYSEVGKGSTFLVLLPAVRAGASEAEIVTAPSETVQGAGTVLVADDEEVIRCTARAMLERHGYKVLLAEHGEQAVALFRASSELVSLVILDLTMPVMGGEEAFEQIRTLRPDVPVLLSSGYSELEATRRFAGKDVAGFVQKPYTSARLLDKVRTAMGFGLRKRRAS